MKCQRKDLRHTIYAPICFVSTVAQGLARCERKPQINSSGGEETCGATADGGICRRESECNARSRRAGVCREARQGLKFWFQNLDRAGLAGGRRRWPRVKERVCRQDASTWGASRGRPASCRGGFPRQTRKRESAPRRCESKEPTALRAGTAGHCGPLPPHPNCFANVTCNFAQLISCPWERESA